jgi:peptidoglycan L-alanyl-D-glutamate endopeptidase CwlK|tara:strand:- start:284 stop:742 length:459 start_codon:yes stop_codon:yes gene_type:complete
MAYKLSKRSLDRLSGVDGRLQAVVNSAIHRSKIDFGVICGIRTLDEQRALVEKGASQTMKSKHLEGLAVDLMAYIGSRGSWELNLYDDIADAVAEAAREVDVPIRWGAAWTVPNIAQFSGGTMEDAMNSYIDERRAQNRRPFIDGPHFELMV